MHALLHFFLFNATARSYSHSPRSKHQAVTVILSDCSVHCLPLLQSSISTHIFLPNPWWIYLPIWSRSPQYDLIFNWRIITRPCWFLLYNSAHQSWLYSSHRGHHGGPGWAPCIMQQLLVGCPFYPWQSICVNATFSICPTLSFPCWIPHLF